jgi:hypothetical protein
LTPNWLGPVPFSGPEFIPGLAYLFFPRPGLKLAYIIPDLAWAFYISPWPEFKSGSAYRFFPEPGSKIRFTGPITSNNNIK